MTKSYINNHKYTHMGNIYNLVLITLFVSLKLYWLSVSEEGYNFLLCLYVNKNKDLKSRGMGDCRYKVKRVARLEDKNK